MSTNNIHCPGCGETISIDQVLSKQIELQIKKKYQQERDVEIRTLEEKEKKLEEKSLELKKQQDSYVETIKKQVDDKLKIEKQSLSKLLRAEIENEQQLKTTSLQEELDKKSQKLKEAREFEIKLREEKSKLEDEKETFELEKLRQIDELKTSLAEEEGKKAEEKQQNIIAQLRKQLSDATKAKDDLARKLEQGSQQTQGEVLELALEDTLRAEFPFDEIEPVPKGVTGADIIQKVNTNQGKLCGQIVWEVKQTKTWQEGWVQKLKDDQRHIKADIAVIVSSVLPKDVSGFMFRDGVWICDVKLSCALASALRTTLIAVKREQALSVGKNEKMDFLYSYLTGVEFKQRIEAIVETFTEMQGDILKERRAYERIWAKREQQAKRVINNTIGLHGDLNGIVSLPHIKALELPGDEDA